MQLFIGYHAIIYRLSQPVFCISETKTQYQEVDTNFLQNQPK